MIVGCARSTVTSANPAPARNSRYNPGRRKRVGWGRWRAAAPAVPNDGARCRRRSANDAELVRSSPGPSRLSDWDGTWIGSWGNKIAGEIPSKIIIKVALRGCWHSPLSSHAIQLQRDHAPPVHAPVDHQLPSGSPWFALPSSVLITGHPQTGARA